MAALANRVRLNYRQQEELAGFLLITPWIVGFLVLTLGPIVASLYFSGTRWDALTPARWIGLGNYSRALLEDGNVRDALRVTFTYSFASVPLKLVLGLALATLMNQNIKGVTLFRTIYYLPAVISGVAVALMWRWVFQPQFGAINTLLSYVGIKGPLWLGSTTWVLPAFIIMSVWGVGGSIVINLAALQGVPTALYEAAEIDGATGWRKFRHITIPGITPVLFFNLVMGVIGSLRTFTAAYATTGGGPGNASLFFALYLYSNAFEYLKMGYASALAWILFLITLVLTLLIFRSSPYWVFYEKETRK